MHKLNLFDNEIKEVRTTVINDEPWYNFEDICKELDINVEYTIDHNYILNNDIYNRLPEETKGFMFYGKDYITRPERLLTLNTKGIYFLLLTLNLENKKINKLKNWMSGEVIPSIIEDGSFTDNENIIDNFRLNNKKYEEKIYIDSSIQEHFRLSKNTLVDGLECTCYMGNNGSILIPKKQINKSLKIINDGGFSEIELKYFKELYPYYIKTRTLGTTRPFSEYLSTFLDIEGLRKIIDIIRKDRYITSELNL